MSSLYSSSGELDELIAALGQVQQRNAAALPDEARHRLHFGARNVNELASIVDHTCSKYQNSAGIEGSIKYWRFIKY